MKADQSLSSIFKQLRPALSQSQARFARTRPTFRAHHLRQYPFLQRPSAPALRFPSPISVVQSRYNSSSASSSPTSVPTSSLEPESELQKPAPSYELTFTCKPCRHRSTHRVTKQGFRHGTVLITCPSCNNRHVFADHLKIFADKAFTIEDLMREKGEHFKRGTLEGDMEFWDDGTQSERVNAQD